MEQEFLSRFVYNKGGNGDGFKNILKSAEGDCDDFAWTILVIRYGYIKAFLKAFFSLQLVWSPSNKYFPRHVVLKDKGMYIDSTVREWRADVAPHKRPIPLGPIAWLLILRGLL